MKKVYLLKTVMSFLVAVVVIGAEIKASLLLRYF